MAEQRTWPESPPRIPDPPPSPDGTGWRVWTTWSCLTHAWGLTIGGTSADYDLIGDSIVKEWERTR